MAGARLLVVESLADHGAPSPTTARRPRCRLRPGRVRDGRRRARHGRRRPRRVEDAAARVLRAEQAAGLPAC